ncbi:unnamed protein product [Peniophora sp. CBMAI 1063]|nr:unnamed protein product [Peniophora sp. CBMAI 1063]
MLTAVTPLTLHSDAHGPPRLRPRLSTYDYVRHDDATATPSDALEDATMHPVYIHVENSRASAPGLASQRSATVARAMGKTFGRGKAKSQQIPLKDILRRTESYDDLMKQVRRPASLDYAKASRDPLMRNYEPLRLPDKIVSLPAPGPLRSHSKILAPTASSSSNAGSERNKGQKLLRDAMLGKMSEAISWQNMVYLDLLASPDTVDITLKEAQRRQRAIKSENGEQLKLYRLRAKEARQRKKDAEGGKPGIGVL